MHSVASVCLCVQRYLIQRAPWARAPKPQGAPNTYFDNLSPISAAFRNLTCLTRPMTKFTMTTKMIMIPIRMMTGHTLDVPVGRGHSRMWTLVSEITPARYWVRVFDIAGFAGTKDYGAHPWNLPPWGPISLAGTRPPSTLRRLGVCMSVLLDSITVQNLNL